MSVNQPSYLELIFTTLCTFMSICETNSTCPSTKPLLPPSEPISSGFSVGSPEAMPLPPCEEVVSLGSSVPFSMISAIMTQLLLSYTFLGEYHLDFHFSPDAFDCVPTLP